MTRWHRVATIGVAGVAGGALGYAAGGGADDQGWLLGLVGFFVAMFLAGKVLSLIWQVGDLTDRRRWLSRRMDETDPSPGLFVAGRSTEATTARFAAMDPLVPELVPDELAALPKMLDPAETVGGSPERRGMASPVSWPSRIGGSSSSQRDNPATRSSRSRSNSDRCSNHSFGCAGHARHHGLGPGGRVRDGGPAAGPFQPVPRDKDSPGVAPPWPVVGDIRGGSSAQEACAR